MGNPSLRLSEVLCLRGNNTFANIPVNTPGRRQSKTLWSKQSKIARKSVIKNPVSNDFYLRSSIVLTFSIAANPVRSMSISNIAISDLPRLWEMEIRFILDINELFFRLYTLKFETMHTVYALTLY